MATIKNTEQYGIDNDSCFLSSHLCLSRLCVSTCSRCRTCPVPSLHEFRAYLSFFFLPSCSSLIIHHALPSGPPLYTHVPSYVCQLNFVSSTWWAIRWRVAICHKCSSSPQLIYNFFIFVIMQERKKTKHQTNVLFFVGWWNLWNVCRYFLFELIIPNSKTCLHACKSALLSLFLRSMENLFPMLMLLFISVLEMEGYQLELVRKLRHLVHIKFYIVVLSKVKVCFYGCCNL